MKLKQVYGRRGTGEDVLFWSKHEEDEMEKVSS